MVELSESGDLAVVQGMMIQGSLSQPENTPGSAIEAHMHDEIEAIEKQLKEKKVALAKKKAEAVTEAKETEEPDDLSSASNDALAGGQASAFDISFLPLPHAMLVATSNGDCCSRHHFLSSGGHGTQHALRAMEVALIKRPRYTPRQQQASGEIPFCFLLFIRSPGPRPPAVMGRQLCCSVGFYRDVKTKKAQGGLSDGLPSLSLGHMCPAA
jgi:hypothetical protein